MLVRLLQSRCPIEPPVGLTPFLDSRLIVVILVRYLEGTLQYDEFGIGGLARRGSLGQRGYGNETSRSSENVMASSVPVVYSYMTPCPSSALRTLFS